MSTAARVASALVASILVAAIAAMSRGNKAAARGRLRAMPIERRRALDEALGRFHALGRPERDALLQLDADLAVLPAEERDRYLDLAHRYHLWLRSLPDERRKALAEAAPQPRMALVEQYREEDRQARESARSDDPIWTYSAVYNPATFGEEAVQIRCWQELSSFQQRDVMDRTNQGERIQRLMRLTHGRRNYSRDEYRHIAPELKAFGKRFDDAAAKKNAEAKGNPPAVRPLFADLEPASKAGAIRPLEDRHFHAHEPPPVAPHVLAHFEADLPPWIRDRIAAFPPVEARRRLTILHFLVKATAAEPPSKDFPKKPAASSKPLPKPPAIP